MVPIATIIHCLCLCPCSWSYRWHSNRNRTWSAVSDHHMLCHLLCLLCETLLKATNTKILPHHYRSHICGFLSRCHSCYCDHQQPGQIRHSLPHQPAQTMAYPVKGQEFPPPYAGHEFKMQPTYQSYPPQPQAGYPPAGYAEQTAILAHEQAYPTEAAPYPTDVNQG